MRNRWIVALGALALTGMVAMADETDPYLWLEDVHGAKPLAWVAEQNARTRAVLKADPRYGQDHDAVLKVLDATDRIPYGGIVRDSVFNFWQDAANPKGVWRRTTIAGYRNSKPHWDTILDIDKLAAGEHENWIWKGADCAPDLRRCLVFLSRDGGDTHVVREFDLSTKTFVKDGFALANAKSDSSIVDGDTVLFATDFGPGTMTKSGYPRIVKIWHRGEPVGAAKTLFEGKPEDIGVGTQVLNGAAGRYALIARSVSFFEIEYYRVTRGGAPDKLDLPLWAVIQGMIGDRLVLTLRKDWVTGDRHFTQGTLLTTAADGSDPQTLFAPGPRQTVEEVSTGRDAIYASIFDNVTGKIHVFRPAGGGDWRHDTLDLPANGSTTIVSTNDFGPEALYGFESYLSPSTLYFDKGDGDAVAIKSLPARFDASGLVTEQFEVASSDGTMIPYFVTRPKVLGGPAPTILYGYGGFEISLTPSYSANFGMLWTTHGGIYVVANIRGGGEFGPAWHEAARFENHQRAFDDFTAVARDLIKRGLTVPAKLGIMGGSNGGLLVSATMVQHPDLFGAVVCQVPLTDMLRFTQIGAGQSWADEYGDPADPKARAYILKYSPYQNVSPKVKYPPVLFTTATSDDRVTPVHARKMAAKMESFGDDVLFFENTDGGHSAGADHKQAAEMWALSFVYLKQKLGLK